ncbi:major facilitator superfamily domain-containing protein [Sporodiniella umbellata]|nr:major facilitator superfamily domain-containing protein [Sporodiniella umbellata]
MESSNVKTSAKKGRENYGAIPKQIPDVVQDIKDKPFGVQKVMLMNHLGTEKDKKMVIAGIVLIAWAKNWESNVVYSSSAYIASAFNALNFASLINIVLYVMETVLLPFYAKIADTLGRTESFAISIVFYILSGIVQASALNMSTLVGGQVIYALGVTGVAILGHVLIADITTSVNRGLFQAFYDFPAIVNIFLAPVVGEALVNAKAWRWAYAMTCICISVTSIPLMVGLVRLEKTVKESGLLPLKSKNKVSFYEKIQKFCKEMDIVGSLLFVGALCMTLLPLVLANPMGGWSSSLTLGCFFSGIICVLAFVVWEYKWAEMPMIPLGKWEDSTPLVGVLCCATVSIFHAANWAYHITYIQISRRASIVTANYIDRSYDAVFLVSQIFSGYLMKRYKVYKPIVFVGLVLLIVGIGFMIPARHPTSSIEFVVATQIIAGFGAGFIYVPILVAVQSSVPASDMAIVTALFQVGGTVATSIGSAIAGAIWNGLLPNEFAKNIPGEYDHSAVLGNITYINHLPEHQHHGAVIAYGNVQKVISIASLGIAVLALLLFSRMRGFILSK